MAQAALTRVAQLLFLAGSLSGSEIGSAQVSETSLPRDRLGPCALAGSADGQSLYVACASARKILVFDQAGERVTRAIDLPLSPLGLVLAQDDHVLYVTGGVTPGAVCPIDLSSGRAMDQIPTGHTTMAPVVSPDGERLFVCNRFDHDVSFIDPRARLTLRRIRVEREPVAAAITPDGKYLVVANHLHAGHANTPYAAASVSIIDVNRGRIAKNVRLPMGSGLARGVAISPDGRFAAVSHLRSMFWLPTTNVDLGGMNSNALTLLDLVSLRYLGTLLLDQAQAGAANPWAVAWSPDGHTIAVSQAGTHDLSLIDAPVEADPNSFHSLVWSAYSSRSSAQGGSIHPVRVRKRLPLPGNGPRALCFRGPDLYVANYFSDDLCRVSWTQPNLSVVTLSLRCSETEQPAANLVAEGERLFNDATLCRGGWQSCASCHDADARADALNWDLLNDGLGNPKNTKSLVWSQQTPPAMALGVRANAGVAVRAGLHHILFASAPAGTAEAIDAYLQSLEPRPSPHLDQGRRSRAAQRGQLLFGSAATRCRECHPPGYYTDGKAHDVGTAGPIEGMWGIAGKDKVTDRFDTPALVELWRTAPYLHDGSAASLHDVLTHRNREDRHGRTSHLTETEMDDLVEFLLSL